MFGLHVLGRTLRQVAALIAEDWTSEATGAMCRPHDVESMVATMGRMARESFIHPEFTFCDQRLIGAWSF